MTTHTDETIASAVVLACLLIALFAILLTAPLLFLLTHMGAACCVIDGAFYLDGCRANAMMRGLPYHAAQCHMLVQAARVKLAATSYAPAASNASSDTS